MGIPRVGWSAPAQELRLENGLWVLLLPHPGSGLVASNVLVGAGSTREAEDVGGSSHFLEHLLFNGTTERTQEELYAAADRIGAYNNATTRQEYTHYMMVVPSERLEAALDIQADMLLHSTLPSDKFEKERGIVLEEMSKDQDDPEHRQSAMLDEMLYGTSSPFAAPVLGSTESIEALPRPTVLEYYERQYVPSNMRIVLMGDFDPESALTIVQEKFGASEESANGPAAVGPVPAPALSLPSQPSYHAREVKAPQPVLRMSLAVQSNGPRDDATLALLWHILGGGDSHRVGTALNDRPELGVARSGSSLNYRQGTMLLTVDVRGDGGFDPTDVATVVLEVVGSLVVITPDELETARTQLLAQEISQLEQLHYYAIFQGDRLWHMGDDYLPRYIAALETLDVDALETTARKLVDSANPQVCVAGPGLESVDEPLRAWVLTTVDAARFALAVPERTMARQRPPELETAEPPSVIAMANGMTLVHAASPSTRMVAMHLLVADRSRRERLRGQADLLHRMLPERAHEGRPTTQDLVGAEIKVTDNPWIPFDDYYTSPLFSFVRLSSVDEYYGETIDYLARMMTSPQLEDWVREEVTGEIGREAHQRTRPANVARARFNEILYAGHPLALAVFGDAEELGAVTDSELAAFATAYLSPDHLVLAMVGDVPRDEAVARVSAAFGTVPTDEPPQPILLPALPLTQTSVREELEVGGQQSALRLGRIVQIDPEDRWALQVAVSLLSGRIQQDLRETRGLAYSLGVSLHVQGDRAAIVARMATRPENLQEAEDALREAMQAGAMTASADGIATTVNKSIGRNRMRRVTSMGQAYSLSYEYFAEGDLEFSQRQAAGLAAVSPEDVARVAEKYLGPGNLVTVIAR